MTAARITDTRCVSRVSGENLRKFEWEDTKGNEESSGLPRKRSGTKRQRQGKRGGTQQNKIESESEQSKLDQHVRASPPWAKQHSGNEGDKCTDDGENELMLRVVQGRGNPLFGRMYDHQRENTPVTISNDISAERWKSFTEIMRPVNGGEQSDSNSRIVDDEWLAQHMADLEKPWQSDTGQGGTSVHTGKVWWILSPSARRKKAHRAYHVVMSNPAVPLLGRLIVLTCSVIALGISGSVLRFSRRVTCTVESSVWIALLVDIFAIVYTMAIAYDEYTSAPLGLRSHRSKMRLLFFDLLFIVFDSANISLAFSALTSEAKICQRANSENGKVNIAGQNMVMKAGKFLVDNTNVSCVVYQSVCTKQKGLTAILLIALVAWLFSFAISTLRVLYRAVDG